MLKLCVSIALLIILAKLSIKIKQSLILSKALYKALALI